MGISIKQRDRRIGADAPSTTSTGNPSAGKLASPLTPVPGRSRPLRGRALAWRSHVTKDAILLTGPLGSATSWSWAGFRFASAATA